MFIRENNMIKLTDGSKITDEQWEKIYWAFKYIRYDFSDVESCKQYIIDSGEEDYFLQEDQSIAMLKVLGIEQTKPLYNPKDIIKANEDAINEFGETEISEYAGYLLTDGRMLDFSDGQDMRINDHRMIGGILDTTGYSEGMIQFMNYGNIRLNNYGFEIVLPPTRPQRNRLIKHINNCKKYEGCCLIDVSNPDGFEIKSFSYDRNCPTADIMNDLDDFFEKIKDYLPTNYADYASGKIATEMEYRNIEDDIERE